MKSNYLKILISSLAMIFISACAEGNGHLTQALAYKERLNLDESEASVAIVAKKRKGIPLYFKKEFNSIIDYDGFDFVFGKSGKFDYANTARHNSNHERKSESVHLPHKPHKKLECHLLT